MGEHGKKPLLGLSKAFRAVFSSREYKLISFAERPAILAFFDYFYPRRQKPRHGGAFGLACPFLGYHTVKDASAAVSSQLAA
jgi:hypothetical protein